MTLRDYLLTALQHHAYRERQWGISVMAVTEPAGDSQVVPYQAIKLNDNEWAYYDPDSQSLVAIEDADPNIALFRGKDKYILHPGDLPNVIETVETTFGRIIANCFYFTNTVGGVIPFVNKEFTRKLLERLFNQYTRDEDDPQFDASQHITTDQFKQCVDSGYALTMFSTLCVPTACPETMHPPKWLLAMRDELLDEYGEDMNKPEIFALVQSQLLTAYREFLMNTPSADFFVSAKTIDDAFNKMFIGWGIERSFGNNTFIKNSLYEGWDLKHFSAMTNSGIAGSYSRGASTADGGEKVKILIRATQNIKITLDDCDTTIGIPWSVTESNYKEFIDSYVLAPEGTTLVDEEYARVSIGSVITVRSPVTCKKEHGDTCLYCAGKHNATNTRGMSPAVSRIGSKLMILSLKKIHKGSKINMVNIDLDEVIF